jgi:hypothetical protein
MRVQLALMVATGRQCVDEVLHINQPETPQCAAADMLLPGIRCGRPAICAMKQLCGVLG